MTAWWITKHWSSIVPYVVAYPVSDVNTVVGPFASADSAGPQLRQATTGSAAATTSATSPMLEAAPDELVAFISSRESIVGSTKLVIDPNLSITDLYKKWHSFKRYHPNQ